MRIHLIICVFLCIFVINGCATKGKEPPAPFDVLETTQPSSKHSKHSKYIVYHFGATWCPPCRNMIKFVWKDQEVIDGLDKQDAKLIMLDADNKDHKKYFKYYKIKSYPTIITLNRKNLETAISRDGYMSKSKVLSTIRKKLL
jgi:thiol-disulfide isomerase/thioredoxin